MEEGTKKSNLGKKVRMKKGIANRARRKKPRERG